MDLKGILAAGGASFNLEGNNPTKGFMVSIVGKEKTFDEKEFSQKDLDEYVRKNETVVASIKNAYFGVWTNKGKVVLDVSLNIEDKFEAIVFGMAGKQQAIFDLNEGKEIFLPMGQTSGTAYQNATYNRMKARHLV